MARETIAALDFNPKSVQLGTNFLLEGTDQWLIDRVSDKIRLIMQKEYGADVVVIYGDEIKAAQLNDTLDTLSIFSTRKLVILRNAESLEKKELAVVADYFSAPADTQSLLIISAKINLTLKAWKLAAAGSVHVSCEPPKWASMLQGWLKTMLREMGRRMTADAIVLFSNRVELDYASAYSELSKLLLLVKPNAVITDQDVLRAIGSSRAGTLTDFYRALGNRDRKQALGAITMMLQSDWQPLQVFFQIVRFYGSIHRILLFKRAHLSDYEIIASHINEVYDKQRKEYVKYADNYSLASMHRIYGILLDTDSQIKLSAASDELLLTTCVLKALDA